MATVHVTVNQAYIRNPVIASQPDDAATATSSASSVEVSGVLGIRDAIWQVTTTGNIWIAFGSNPAAGSGGGHLILANTTREFICKSDGEEIAIKDA